MTNEMKNESPYAVPSTGAQCNAEDVKSNWEEKRCKQFMIVKLVLFGLICVFNQTAFTQQSQQYQVRNIKFKKGMAEEGMRIGMKYFKRATAAAGIDTKVLRFYSGPWDVQIMIHLLEESSVEEVVFGLGNRSAEIWQEMLKIGGSEENVNSDLKKYNQTILTEEISYAKMVVQKK